MKASFGGKAPYSSTWKLRKSSPRSIFSRNRSRTAFPIRRSGKSKRAVIRKPKSNKEQTGDIFIFWF